MLFDIIIAVLWLLIAVFWIIDHFRLKKLVKRAMRIDEDINTLHYNEVVLSSSLNEVAKQLRKYGTFKKDIRKHVRAINQQEKQQDEERAGD